MENSLNISFSSTSASGTGPMEKVRSPFQATQATSDWHRHFSIPDACKFSESVQEAINTGVVTAKARREIIQVLRTLMITYTHYPTSEQYIVVCQNLITKYPKLRDDKENPFVRKYTNCVHCL